MSIMRFFSKFFQITILCLVFCVYVPLYAASSPSFNYTSVGNSEDKKCQPKSGIALMGGGKDQDDAFKWMIEQAGHGDVVVLRASGDGAYNEYIFNLAPTNSVHTIVFNNRDAASSEFVVEKIRAAEGIFFAGGDQWKYISFWKDTPVQKAINDAIDRDAVIGGTSAGLAILGEFCFSAENGSIVSREALEDPYHSRMCLEKGIFKLDKLKNVITDSHFANRDRMGRLISFVARLIQDGSTKEAIGIGVDERAALLIDENGEGTLCGSGAVYIVKPSEDPDGCQRKKDLKFKNLSVYKLLQGSHFNIKQFKGSGATTFNLSAESGKIKSSAPDGCVY